MRLFALEFFLETDEEVPSSWADFVDWLSDQDREVKVHDFEVFELNRSKIYK